MEEVAQLIKVIMMLVVLILFAYDTTSYLFKRKIEDGVGAILWTLIIIAFK